jgi:hypothetical protein
MTTKFRSDEERDAWVAFAAEILSKFDTERPALAAQRAAECADALLLEFTRRCDG